MNRFNAKDYMPLVQGLAEGKTIQFKSKQWEDIPCNSEFKWNNCPSHYRIKPEPRTWKIYVDPSGQIADGYDYHYAKHQGWERITVQEVLA